DLDRADLLGPEDAQTAALDHRRAAHAQRGVLGGDDHVAAAEDRGVARKAAAGIDAHQRDRPGELAPELEAAGEAAALGVAGPPAAALGEEHRRRPPAVDQL